jgi:hypothetical protein
MEGRAISLPHNKSKKEENMIERLKRKNLVDIFDFIYRVNDTYQDFYITIDKNRTFLKNYQIINKVIDRQELYGLFEGELKGILLIYREKGFRPYIKILATSKDSQLNLIKFLIWNFSNQDLYIKLKKRNPLSSLIQRYGFIFQGDRGEEILLFRKGEKSIRKIGDKDEHDNR